MPPVPYGSYRVHSFFVAAVYARRSRRLHTHSGVSARVHERGNEKMQIAAGVEILASELPDKGVEPGKFNS